MERIKVGSGNFFKLLRLQVAEDQADDAAPNGYSLAEVCAVSDDPENTAAKSLYAAAGFAPNGETDEGEEVAVLAL